MFNPSITDLEKKLVLDAMDNWSGSKMYYYCEKFEEEFAKYIGRKYALMTTNCTSSIHLVLASLDVTNSDIIVPELTWIATTLGAYHLNNEIIFADVEPYSLCIDIDSIIKRTTPNTSAIIGVNLYGNMANWDKLTDWCNTNNIYLIEDAAQSLGCTYCGIKSGNFGIASVFSFHRTKTLTTGEGGMIVTDNQDLYEQCKLLRDLGRKPGSYHNEIIGYKYMPFNVQAAIGLGQLQRIDELLAHKQWIHLEYKEYLDDIINVELSKTLPYTINSRWCNHIFLDIPYNTFETNMNSQGFEVRPFFTPLSSLPAYNLKFFYENKNINSYKIHNYGALLPSGFDLTKENIQNISKGIKNAVS